MYTTHLLRNGLIFFALVGVGDALGEVNKLHAKLKIRSTWLAQVIKHLTLDLCSGLDFKSCVGLRAGCRVSLKNPTRKGCTAWSVSPSPARCGRVPKLTYFAPLPLEEDVGKEVWQFPLGSHGTHFTVRSSHRQT